VGLVPGIPQEPQDPGSVNLSVNLATSLHGPKGRKKRRRSFFSTQVELATAFSRRFGDVATKGGCCGDASCLFGRHHPAMETRCPLTSRRHRHPDVWETSPAIGIRCELHNENRSSTRPRGRFEVARATSVGTVPSQVHARQRLELMHATFIGPVGEVQARGTTEARLADEAPLTFPLLLDLGGR